MKRIKNEKMLGINSTYGHLLDNMNLDRVKHYFKTTTFKRKQKTQNVNGTLSFDNNN